MSPAHLIRLAKAFIAECEAIAAEESAKCVDWVEQSKSALGPRRHCKAVKRRVALGNGSAAIVGRRHLLSQVAYSEELARPSVAKPHKGSIADELRAELRLIGGRR